MTSILSVIGSVDRRVESHRVAAKAAAESAAGPGPIIAAAAGPMQGVLGYGERLVRHSEQYKHNVGWTFTAVHRIATRMADQPARVGRLLPPDASEYVRSWTKRHGFKVVDAAWRSRFGRRLLSPEDRALMPRRLKSASGEYEIIENHEILDALYDPNEIMTASTLCYVTVASFELTGKAYWWWSRQGGRLQVWHLPSDWVTPNHTDDAMYVSYDVKPPGYFADTITVPAEDITPFLLPDPSDPHKTVSPAQTQAPAIAADEAIQVAQARQFTNDMYPGLILKVGRLPGIDGKLGDRPILTRSQRKDLIEAARSVYEGSVNYREPFIVDGLIEGVERMTYTPAEMDYLQSGQSTKSRIMQSFGVNPFLSGENVTIGYAQASVAEDVFLANVINPLGRLMGEAVSKRLRPDGYVLWFEEAYPRNPELNLRKYALALTNPAGALVSEEEFRREVLQLPPREAKEEEPPSDEPGSEPPGGEIEEESRRLSLPAPAGKTSKRSIAEYAKLLKRVRPEQAEVHERDMEKSMGRFFVKVARSIGKAMDDLSDEILLGGPSAAGLLYRAADWADEIKAAAGPPLVRAAVAGYETAKAIFEDRMADIKAVMPAATKIAAGGWDPSEGTFLEGWELPATVRNAIDFGVTETLSQQYWQDILATTGDEVAGTLRTAMEEQWNRTDLKHQIMRDIGDTEGIRSRRIARTECLPADATVDGAIATAAYRRWYEGPMVKIVTKAGREFTGSPNHPVLTLRGWIALGDLMESDNLVAYRSDVKTPSTTGDQNIQATPATIGEVFDSLSAVAVFCRERCGKPDFHGDGREGDVDVLRPDGMLPIGRFVPIDEFSVDGVLAPADMRRVVRFAQRAPFRRYPSIYQGHRVCETTHWNTASLQSPRDGRFLYVKSMGNRWGRLASLIGFDNLAPREILRDASVACSHQGLSSLAVIASETDSRKGRPHSILADAHFVGDLGGAEPGMIERDGLVNLIALQPKLQQRSLSDRASNACLSANLSHPIRTGADHRGDRSRSHSGRIEIDRLANLVWINDWSGHVYNLTTRDGYFISNGLYTGNTTGAMNMGHQAQAFELEQDYGLHPIRIWTTVGDFLVRETHVAADGQQRPGMEKFEVGGYRCDFPGDWSLPAAERINCLVDPETPILIGPKFGKTKPIKDIQVGDLVLTHQGRFRRVARLAEEQTYSGVVHIITTDASELRLTPGHLVLTTRGWKPVEEIRLLDWVRVGLPVNQRSVRRSNDIRVALQHVLVSGASWEFVKGATLFNFAVDEDESYVAGGVCLHNCRCAVLTDLQELREGGFTGETPALHGEEL